MKTGVIADFKVTEKMLTYFIQKAHNRRVLVHPRIVIGVRTKVEKALAGETGAEMVAGVIEPIAVGVLRTDEHGARGPRGSDAMP